MTEDNLKVVICGGGVIGLCVAYFLSKRGVIATVVEKNVIAGAASGNAGGFLARDWNKDSAQDNFSEASFDLHAKLAKELNGEKEYGYRRLTSYSVTLDEENETKTSYQDLPSWLDGVVVTDPYLKIGSPSTTAQVHPYQFCLTLQKECASKGVKFLTQTEVTDIKCINDTTKIVVVNKNEELLANVVVIAMGPWTGIAQNWISSLPSVLYGQKAHAITMIPKIPVTADAIFASYGSMSPDIYPRPDGEVYTCGIVENPKPSKTLESVETVTTTPGACEKLKSIIDKTSSNLQHCDMKSKHACYIPLTQDGLPLVGKLQNCESVYIAAGHGCWGILNGPITGLSISELIMNDSRMSVDLSPFDPSRFLE